MALLIAAVIIVGCLCMLDLLLTFGVLRRLREHAELLTRAGTTADPALGLAAGERPAAFAATSTSGQALTGPDGLRLAAFFSASCSVCPGKVAPFVEYVQSRRLDRGSVLAVIATEGGAPYAGDLSTAAQVCIEPHGGEISQAFTVRGFPAFFLLDRAGRIVATEFDPEALPEPAIA
jgi:hypothetical protein